MSEQTRRALAIAMWGRHRWRSEIRFKTQKREGEEGFVLENTFTVEWNWRPSTSTTRTKKRIG